MRKQFSNPRMKQQYLCRKNIVTHQWREKIPNKKFAVELKNVAEKTFQQLTIHDETCT